MSASSHKQAPTNGPIVQRMPDDLANQIAAGEVVERPASAVKELVENAIDAGATSISVQLEEGGLRLIRVTDNGRGMVREDAELCVQRHATSKLTTRDQLFHISTLGFRGEALPSIASVSRFELLSKPHGTIGGTRIRVEGGAEPVVEEIGTPPGTQVVVRDLFFNTPARLKFLKTRSTELKHVLEAVQRLAIPNPHVGFRVEHNDRVILDLPAVEASSDRLYALFGREVSEDLYPLMPAEQDGVQCGGFMSQPARTVRTTAQLWAFVNGRYVRDRTILGAIRVGYQGLIDRGRHPIVVLFIDVPPQQVDVNVHPMKIEVRFHESSSVFRAVRRALATTLAECPWVPNGEESTGGFRLRPDSVAPARPDTPQPTQEEIPVRTYTLHRSGSQSPRRDSPSSFGSQGHAKPNVADRGAQLTHPSGASARPEADGDAMREDTSHQLAPETDLRDAFDGLASRPLARRSFFSSLHYIGHFRGTYLLCNDSTGLVVVDQHAAHERITFETLRDAWVERRSACQPLLFPAVLELDSLRAAILSDNLEVFERLGFEVEPFGGNDFALKAVPAILSTANHDALIRDALDELGDTGHSSRIETAVDDVLIRMACHGSVRAGDTLDRQEVTRLFEDLDRIDFGANCPHGRPVWFRMSLDELERRFDRK